MYVKRLEQHDSRLGRHIVHDPASKGYPMGIGIDKSTWHSKKIRIYDPSPNPNQVLGDCTGCAKAIQMNAVGNRAKGVINNLEVADKIYSLATTLDPFEGSYPPDDTGSSGLAAAKAAQQLGLGTSYYWYFGGADEVIQGVMNGHVANVGTEWHYDMFNQDAHGQVHLGGGIAGGHEWSVRGYDLDYDLVLGRCWWGEFRDFWISRADLDTLLRNDGDALVQSHV